MNIFVEKDFPQIKVAAVHESAQFESIRCSATKAADSAVHTHFQKSTWAKQLVIDALVLERETCCL